MQTKQNEIIDCFINGVKPKEKYPEAFRQFCFTTHFHSPRTYNFIRETFNNHLPHPTTIRSWYANSDLHTEPNVINEQCLNIIRKKVTENALKGKQLVCGVLFDEVSIRKHVQWVNAKRKFLGYSQSAKSDHLEESQAQDNSNNGNAKTKPKSDIANQALVFVVRGVNDTFELPVAYYFINSMDGESKKKLIEKIIEELIGCGVLVSNITFDGCPTNKKMCRLLGAVLDVGSPFFKPYFRIKNQNIHIFFDVCHMQKLVRNRLAIKGVLYDGCENKIKWQYFVELVRMADRGFELTHKMNQSHIDWKSNKMKVDLAVQTLSESTAASIDLLMKKGVVEFDGAESTIVFIRMFNQLFDVFNTKHDESDNPFKRALSVNNASEIFELFENAINYIKSLKIKNSKGKFVRVYKSRINTGFSGFVINIVSLKLLYQEYIEERQIMQILRTYNFQQDPVEILFGKIRSLNGFNDNPTCEQFSAAMRKLLAYNTIMFSKFSNCKLTDENTFNPYSNILSITSRRPTSSKFDPTECQNVTDAQIEGLYEKLNAIGEKGDEELSDCTIAHVANCIELNIKSKKKFNCALCKNVFEENANETDEPIYGRESHRLCHSTFLICKQADRFLKHDVMKDSFNFEVVYHEILQSLQFDNLYSKTDFSEDIEHKIFLIRFVVDEYIRIKCTQMAKTATLHEHQNSLRARLHKLLHFLGQ